MKLDFFILHLKCPHGAALGANTAQRAEGFIKQACIIAFHCQGRGRKKLQGDQHSAAAGTTAAHGFHFLGIQNMYNQTFCLALLQDSQSLIGADVAGHLVFHIIVGESFKLQARLRGMYAGLSIHAHGFAAKALGNCDAGFSLDDGSRIIVRRDRPISYDFGIDGN